MSKYENAIKRYELARQEVKRISGKKRFIVSSCDRITSNRDPYESVKTCLQECYEDTKQMTVRNCEYYSFREVLESGEFDYCDSCKEAHGIKTGPLAEAKAELGNAKRSLSALGKGLINAPLMP